MRKPTTTKTPSVAKVTDSTVKFYEAHAREYFDKTVSADLSPLYDEFLSHVRPGGRVLDVGCGSGRDLKVFRSRGFDAVGIDASKTLVQLARKFSGASCIAMRFEDVRFRESFDAVWACASLLHVPKRRIVLILRRLRKALIGKGALFASVKLGQGEILDSDGRFFAYYPPDEFALQVQRVGFDVGRVWVSEDSLRCRTETRWINLIAHKKEDASLRDSFADDLQVQFSTALTNAL